MGARRWILDRRNGLAREIFCHLIADAWYTGRQVLAEVRWRLTAKISASGYSASQFVFGSNLVDLYEWDDQDEDLLFATAVSISGQPAPQRELRMMAKEAALKEVGHSKVRRLPAYSGTCDCADVEFGDSALFLTMPNRESHPKLRVPARILDIAETGAVAR